MAYTPSIGLDQNREGKFVDKYWGRVPMYLHIIPETLNTDTPIVECNPDFMILFQGILSGTIDIENISKELQAELKDVINKIPQYGRIIMPYLDPFFMCALGPKDPTMQCSMIADKSCHPIVTSEGCFLSMQAINPWQYVYFTDADPLSYGVFVLDWRNMSLIEHVATLGRNPHSIDRAVFSNRMFIRTQDEYSFDVFDAQTREILKSVSLGFKPRTTGDPNKLLNVQLIAGKDHPKIAVIDVMYDDKIIAIVGEDKKLGQTVTGNQGGSACGHPAWFDTHHFGLLDRVNGVVKVYEIKETGKLPLRFDITKKQELPTPTGSHTIDSDVIHTDFTRDNEFFVVSEGFKGSGKSPGIHKVLWKGKRLTYAKDSSGNPIEQYMPAPSNDQDASHHYGHQLQTNEIWYPTFKSKKMWVMDAETLAIKREYDVGYGAGHVSFSYKWEYACVTNHFDNVVTIVDMKDNTTVHQIKVNTEPIIPATHLIQTHENKILPREDEYPLDADAGKYYFLGVTTPTGGEFKRIDLEALRGGSEVIETIVTGGHPEQSTS